MRRGQGTVLLTAIFLGIFAVSIIPLTFYIYTTYIETQRISWSTPTYNLDRAVMGSALKDVNATAILEPDNILGIYIENRAGRQISIESILAYIVCNSITRYINIENRSIEIEPGYRVENHYNLSTYCRNVDDVYAVYATTIDGHVIVFRIIKPQFLQGSTTITQFASPPSKAIQIIPLPIRQSDQIWNTAGILQQSFHLAELDNTTLPKKLSFPISLTGGMTGGISGGSYVWNLKNIFTAVNILIDDRSIYNLWIGYDPRSSQKYNILFTSPSITIRIGNTQYTFCSSSYSRIKIYGFTSNSPLGILRLGSSWISSPSQDIADYTFIPIVESRKLYLQGQADRIEVYCRESGSQSGYDPYIVIMNNVNSPSYGKILFTSIDHRYGSKNTRNDNDNKLLDYSTKPLALVYRDAISNKNFTAVAIAINYRFHDNEGSDADGTSIDKPIMFVGVIDEQGNIISYRGFSFRELTRYEDTYPPTAQAQSSVIFIPLPSTEIIGEKSFYVFIAFQDPYWYNGNLDDLDFTLFIESLSVTLFQNVG